MSNTRDNFIAIFSASKLSNKDGFFSTSDPFLLISRYRMSCCFDGLFASIRLNLDLSIYPTLRVNEDGSWTAVWRSRHVESNLSPRFPQAVIPMALLCNGDIDRPLKIEIFGHEKSGKHSFMGQVLRRKIVVYTL